MARMERRIPGRRTMASVIATALAATGIVLAGVSVDDAEDHHAGPAKRSRAVTEPAALDRARRTGNPVEVTAARTERSTTFARPDGLLAKKLYASAVRAKVNGEWHPVDTSLHRTEAGWETRSTSTRMVFSSGGGSGPATSGKRASRAGAQRISLARSAATATDAVANDLVTLYVGETGQYPIQLTWPGPVPVPVIDGSRALYPDILPGADLVLTADNEGFAQLLVLKNRAAAANPMVQQLSYGITSPELTFRLDPESGIVTAESAYGDEVANSATPLMWDSAGEPAVTDGQVGATAQPTASEPAEPSSSVSWSPEPVPTDTENELVESDEQTDQEGEASALPSASDDAEILPSESPLPDPPGEPTPAPTQSGSAATLSLPSLNGPSPDSRGDVVASGLEGTNWLLNPSRDFLDDPATTYPVFIDPSVKKHTQNWTTAYSRHPKATFYNGKSFNKGGTHEARVGFESDTWGTSRSYFNVAFDKGLKGARIMSAKLRMLETYSWSCQERAMSVHLTGEVNSKTNWNNAPKLHDGNKLSTKSFAHGYKSGCRDAYETFDVKKAAQNRADKGDDSITFGLRARDEHSQYAWKKFQANGDSAPVLDLVYNRTPSAPVRLDLEPEGKCTAKTPYVRMGAGSVTFEAQASDKDKNLDHLNFDLWPTGKWGATGDLLGSSGTVSTGSDKDTAFRSTSAFSTSRLTNGTLYSWRVRAVDDAGSSSSYSPAKTPCRFILDTSAPKPPKVSSTDFPDADGNENGFGNDAEDANWSTKKFGTPGSFTFRALNTDAIRYEYSFNGGNYNFSKSRTAGTATTVTATVTDAKPPTAGPNVLYVRAVDQAGNVSDPTLYFFYVSPRDQADAPGDFTGDKLPDLMTVTEEGNLSLYPSQGQATAVTTGSGDLDYSMSGAYRANPAKDPSNEDGLQAFVAAPKGHFKGALITHNGDIYGGDGLQDLVVRVENRLWVYPGDGYGAVNVDKRRQILLPAGAPSPASITQILAAGDITGDGRTDFFATVGDELWVFTGYHGATIETATRLAASTWTDRDLVTLGDVSGDGVADLVFRSDVSSKLWLRKGIKDSAGHGVTLGSLASGAASSGGADTDYGSSGWSSANIPLLVGIPDANGDGIPDVWTVRSDGSVRFYAGATTVLPGSGVEIITPRSYWKTRVAIG